MHTRVTTVIRCIATAFLGLAAVWVPVLGGGGIAAAATVSCSGVSVAPGANVQNVVNAKPAGTTFCFQPGTYVLTQPVIPKSNDQLISVVTRGAVFTGNNVYNAGLRGAVGSAGQHDVLVSGFVFTRFRECDGQQGGGDDRRQLEDHRQRDHQQRTRSGSRSPVATSVRDNFIHHNGRYGVSGGPDTNILIENNEISFNNTAHYDIGAGGAKITKSTYVTFRANNVHDNYGNGLHTGTDSFKITYENNTVTNNWGVGIFHENVRRRRHPQQHTHRQRQDGSPGSRCSTAPTSTSTIPRTPRSTATPSMPACTASACTTTPAAPAPTACTRSATSTSTTTRSPCPPAA